MGTAKVFALWNTYSALAILWTFGWCAASFKAVIGPPPFRFRQTNIRWGKASFDSIVTLGVSTSSSSSAIHHFNHAGASPSPTCVIERVVDHMYLEQRLGGYAAASAVEEELGQVYKSTATLLNAASPDEIALVESATVGWTRLFYSMVDHCDRVKKGKKKVILVSEAEYAAQVVAMVEWAQDDEQWQVIALPSALKDDGSSTGTVDLKIFEKMLQGQYMHVGKALDPETIALVCITHIPTNSGVVNPAEEIGQILTKYKTDAFYLLDACQSVGQLNLNVQKIQCHGLCGTGRKYLRAPRGSGFLYINFATASILRPSHVDHACAPLGSVPIYPNLDISSTSSSVRVDYRFAEGAKRFEFWESSIACKLGFGAAIRYAMEDAGGMELISQRILQNALKLRQQLQTIDNLMIHHPGTRSGLITFNTTMDADEVRRQLWRPDINGNQFEVSVVPATSTPLDSERTGVPDLVRSSVSYTTTSDDIKLFCERLKDILKT